MNFSKKKAPSKNNYSKSYFNDQKPAKKVSQANPKSFSSPKRRKTHRRALSDGYSLVPLKGKELTKGGIIFKNQIFRDIYDELGNHDRTLVTIDSIELYEESRTGIYRTYNNQSDMLTEKLIDPQSSYRSIQETLPKIQNELLSKLEELAKKQKTDILKSVSLDRNKDQYFAFFSFPVRN